VPPGTCRGPVQPGRSCHDPRPEGGDRGGGASGDNER